MPRLFVGQNAGQFVITLPNTAYIEYILFTAVIMYAVLGNSSFLIALIKGIFSRDSDTPIPHPITLILLFVIIHVFIDVFSVGTSRYPRYFISFFPLIVVILGYVTASLTKRQRISSKFVAAALLVFIPGLGLYNHISYIRPCFVTDDVLNKQRQLINRPTSGETVPAIIRYLKRHNISCFRGTYFIQWRIIFESREQIIGSSRGLWPTAARYPLYDHMVRNFFRIALILHKDDVQLESFLSSGMQWEFDSCQKIGEYLIFIGNQPESFKNLNSDGSQLF